MRFPFLFFIVLQLSTTTYSQSNSGYLTKDGAWCWFSDPRTIMTEDYVFAGWVKSNGTIEASRLNLKTFEIETSKLYHKLEKDDHNNPSFALFDSGKLIAMYSKHSKKDLYINVLYDINQEFSFGKAIHINPNDRAELRLYRRNTITYANPIVLKAEENRLYSFGRWTGYKPNVMWSNNLGDSWTKGKVFISKKPFNKYDRPYVKYFSDGESKIHMIFTDGHPNTEPDNSVYYALYSGGNFYNDKGELISVLENAPFEPKEASVIYEGNELEGRAWIADIAQDNKGNPVVLYTKSPKKNIHEYWYASLYNNNWINYKICDSGKWFPQTKQGKKEGEPYYFGNMTLHPDKSNVVYLSRQINGVFEIERWETGDLGQTWKTEAITRNSKRNNVRPFVPRGIKSNEDEIVLWMENRKYLNFTKFKTAIKYNIRKIDISNK